MRAKKKWILWLFVFSAVSSWAQQNRLHYFVIDEESRPLDYFNVIVSNLPDSTYVSGETYLNGRMELPTGLTGHKIVQISSLGYEDLSYIEDFSNPSAPDTIVMRKAIIEMDAVVVSSRMPTLSTSHGKTVVRVAGSSLQHLPEIQDILRRAPSVRVDNSGLTVFGKGTPQIYLDGRESSYDELLLLQPSQILSLEIDRNPSSQYDASYASVVRVRTIRAQAGTSGQLTNHSYQGRRYSNVVSAQLQIAGKKWVNYFSYQHSYRVSRDYVNDTEAIHRHETPIVDSANYDDRYLSRSIAVLYGSTLDLNLRHRLSWQYSGTFRNGQTKGLHREHVFQSDHIQNISANYVAGSRGNSHVANFGYRFAVDSVRTLEVAVDYARSNPKRDERIARHYIESDDKDVVSIINRSVADVYSAKAEYTTPLWGAELLAGGRYGRINSRTTTDFDSERNTTLLKSDNIAAYATLGDEYDKWGWLVGMRSEFLNDDILVNRQTLRKGWQNSLFPSLKFYTSELSKTINISFSYTSRIERPTVSQLDPSTTYINSVVMGSGNPLLLSTIKHNLEFGMTLWNNLSLLFGTNYDLNPSIYAGELSEGGNLIAFKPLNVSHSCSYLADATYSNQWGIFSMTLNSGIEFPRVKIPYMGETISVGKPFWYASIYADITIRKNTYLTGEFDYVGRSYYLMTVGEPTNNLTLGITQYLFDRRIQLSLYGYDLLRGSNSGWRDRYGFYETSQTSSRDSRMVRFSVRWLFNNYKTRYRERSRSEEYNRIN